MILKYSKRYLKGFREGFNNPSQHTTKILNGDDPPIIAGIVAGYLKRKQRQIEGKSYFLMDYNAVIREIQGD